MLTQGLDDEPRRAFGSAGLAQGADHLVVAPRDLLASGLVVAQAQQSHLDLIHREVAAKELDDHLVPRDQVDERDVGDVEETLEDEVGQPASGGAVANDLGDAEEAGLQRGRAGGDERRVALAQQVVGLAEDEPDRPLGDEFLVKLRLDARRPGDDPDVLREIVRRAEHGGEIVADLLLAAARQDGDDGSFRLQLVSRAEIPIVPRARFAETADGVERRVAHVVHRVIQALEKRHLEGQDAEHAVDVAAEGLDPVALPGPDLGRYIIMYGNTQLLVHEAGHFQVETGVIDQDHHVGAIGADVVLAGAEVAQDRPEVRQDRDEAHVGHFPVMARQVASGLAHQVAAHAAEFRLRVLALQGAHEVRAVQVARGLSRDQVVFHFLKIRGSNGSRSP